MRKPEPHEGLIRYDLDITADKVPYHIKVTPFLFNDQKRFHILINDESDHVLVWDPEVVQLRPIDDEGATLPDDLVKAISDKLVKTIII